MSDEPTFTGDEVAAFTRSAVAVAVAAEREACAKICIAYAERHAKGDTHTNAQAWMMLQCAVAIRAQN